MLDFIPAADRKRIYRLLGLVNAAALPLLQILVLTGAISMDVQAQVVAIIANIISAAGFLLADKNVTLPEDPTN